MICLTPVNYSVNANEDDFDQLVIEASRRVPVLVDFWADWCGPCRVLTPVLEKLVQEYAGQFILAKVEADENMRLAGRYKLRGFPTVLLFKHGEVQDQFSGARTAGFVRDFIDPHLNLPGTGEQGA
jgi:putative thioredoxin